MYLNMRYLARNIFTTREPIVCAPGRPPRAGERPSENHQAFSLVTARPGTGGAQPGPLAVLRLILLFLLSRVSVGRPSGLPVPPIAPKKFDAPPPARAGRSQGASGPAFQPFVRPVVRLAAHGRDVGSGGSCGRGLHAGFHSAKNAP